MDINDLKGDAPVITLDEIKGRFAKRTQRQDYYETKDDQPSDQQQEFVRDPLYDPNRETTLSDYSGNWDDVQEQERNVSPERAQRTGRQIAKVIDTSFNFIASKFIAHSDKDYKASPSDLEDIAEAWGEIAHDKQWEVSPYLQLTILYLIVYAPLAKQALADRQIQEISHKQDEQEERIRILENELARQQESNKKE